MIIEHIPEKNTNATLSKHPQFRKRSASILSVLPHSTSYNFLPIVDG